MAQTELDHTESWTITIRRDGDDWPDVEMGGYFRPQTVFIDKITCELRRGAKRPDIHAIGRARKKDGTVGLRERFLIFADDYGWIVSLVLEARQEYGLTAAGTGVPL